MTGLIKMRLRFLARGMCEWHVRSNTQQRQLFAIVLLFHALYCEEIPLAQKRQHCYKALIFWYFFIKGKVRRYKH